MHALRQKRDKNNVPSYKSSYKEYNFVHMSGHVYSYYTEPVRAD